jgi:hypothetical protein
MVPRSFLLERGLTLAFLFVGVVEDESERFEFILNLAVLVG